MLIVGLVDLFPGARREELRNRRIILGRVRERLLHQPEARVETERSAMVGEFGRDVAVVERIGDGRHAQVVLRRGADHARAADVDVRPGHFGRDARLRDRLRERIEIHDHHVDRIRRKALEVRLVRIVVLLGEEPKVNLEVKRLHETALHLRLTRIVRDRDERLVRLGAQNLLDLHVGPAGRVDLHARAGLDERGDEGLKPRLVAHAHEHVLDLNAIVDLCDDVQGHFLQSFMVKST